MNGILGRLARLETPKVAVAEQPSSEAPSVTADAADAAEPGDAEIPTMGILSDFKPSEAPSSNEA